MTTGSLCLTEILKSWKSCSSKSEASQTADSTRASGVALPYFSIRRGSSEPALTPMRIEVPAALAAAAICLTWSSNLRMLPGFTRTAAQPASMAAKTYFGWKWMSAMTGICDFLAMIGRASASSADGAGNAHDVAAGGRELGDLLQGRVDVRGRGRRHRLDADGAVRTYANRTDLDLSGLAARGEDWRGCRWHSEADRGQDFLRGVECGSSSIIPPQTPGACRPATRRTVRSRALTASAAGIGAAGPRRGD